MRKRLLVGIGLAVALTIGAWIRFQGLTTKGMEGADTFQYLEIAELWSRGKLAFNNDAKEYRQYFRPVFYATYWAALKIFGLTDWSMRALLGLFDLGTILLVATFVWRVTGGVATATLAGAFIYALNPTAIFYSRIELTHSLGAFWVILAFVLAAESTLRRSNRYWMAAAGLALGLATWTHGDIGFLGLGFVATLALARLGNRGEFTRVRRRAFGDTVLFTAMFFLPYVLWGLGDGFGRMIAAIRSESEIRQGPTPPFGEFLLRLYWDGFADLTSRTYVVLMSIFACFGLLTWRRVHHPAERAWVAGPWIAIALHLILFAVILKDAYLPRLFVPLLPILITAPLLTMTFALRTAGRPRLAPLTTAIFAGFVLFANYERGAGLFASFLNPTPEQVRSVYDAVGADVTEDRKLLVTPSIHYSHRRQFNASVYFGKNAIYLVDCKQGTLENFVREHKIGFITITAAEGWDSAALDNKRFQHIGACVGETPTTYNAVKETEFVQAYAKMHGHLVFRGARGELVYDLD